MAGYRKLALYLLVIWGFIVVVALSVWLLTRAPSSLMMIKHGRNQELKDALQHNFFDLNERDDAGFGVVDYAVRRRSLDMVRLLLEHGADVNAKSDAGGTPLNTAIKYRDEEIVRLLIQSGADVNNHDHKESWTPLVYAVVDSFSPRTIECLLSHNADVNVTVSKDETVLDYAIKQNNVGTVTILRKFGAKTAAELATRPTKQLD